MKLFKGRGPKRYSLPNGQVLSCTVCRNERFDRASYKLNTSGMELMNLAWANKDATCMVCSECGHILWFAF
ncbi:DNA-binding protein [Actinomadura logoneensis]|uniref:DNA-binding protein n=1 Tax=Actinomadura logoneensis TaxID=2293572 RepID=A0A372J8Y3_9ACTN|nr:DNA-binding protein [Actinomadura logoneensis]RFU36465.1 DNA-binding protein [Actinomadura logoneensis]